MTNISKAVGLVPDALPVRGKIDLKDGFIIEFVFPVEHVLVDIERNQGIGTFFHYLVKCGHRTVL